MWHEGASSRRKIGGNSKDLAAITAQVSILGREMKKLLKQVHYVHVSCELRNGSHISKDFPNKELVKEAEEIYYGQFYQRPYPNRGRYRASAPGYYVKDENKMGYQEKRLNLEEITNQITQVVRERVPGTLPSSTKTNPRDQVKVISTIEGTQTNPNSISSLRPPVSCLSVQAKQANVGVSISNKANEESSNEALMFISKDDCIDLDDMERSILAKVKDLSVITDLLKYMSSEGFVDVGLRYVGGRWVWLEFDSTDQVLNELFLELKYVSYDFIPDERCVWIDLVGLPLASWAPEVCVLTESLHRVLESFKVSYLNRSYCITATEFAYWAPNIESTEEKFMADSLERKNDEGPSLDGGPEHEEPLDVVNCDSVSSKDDNNDLDSSSEMSSTSRLMREVDVRGVDSDHVDSFEEGEIIGDSVLNNDGCVKDCMEHNLDDDVEKDIDDCSKNVTEKCGVVNNNMSNNVEGEILEDHLDGDRRNDTIEDNADVNPSINVYLDINQNTSIPEVVEDLSSLDKVVIRQND
uniref:5-oxoprolinase-like protein n=1 Tax=Tanacetum cinerariifolium TaxID=118510 RepID=A0A6L2MCY7_TANCI|nr:5-oxoprolinase-like protein [Tanacetum cinerariifolium]